jgi:hypothetical protein
VPEIGVVPQRFKYPSRAAIGDIGRGCENTAQEIGARLG